MKAHSIKRLPLQIAAFIACLLFIQCTKVIKKAISQPTSTANDNHNSANTLDWEGTYKGTIPCADCAGIDIEITLNKEQEYVLKTNYLGKNEDTVEEKGRFTWNKAGNTLTLLGVKDKPNQYFVGENRILQLDKLGNKITDNAADKYFLNKQPFTTMPDTSKLAGTWELNYITGSRIAFEGLYPNKKPTITFDIPKNWVNGNTSCNSFSGKLNVMGNKIDFTGPLAMTKMMCLDGKGENVFIETLQKVNTYTIGNDSTLNFKTDDIVTMRFVKKE